MKKIYKYWTVQSSNLKDFENEINADIEIGWKILEGGYGIIESEEGQKYSQVLFWEEEEKENLYYNFKPVVDETGHETMEITCSIHDNDGSRKETLFIKRRGFGGKYVKRYFDTFPPSGNTLYTKFTKTIDETGEVIHLKQYEESKRFKNTNGNLIGEFINGPLRCNFDKIQKEHEFWNFEEGIETELWVGGAHYSLRGLLTYRKFFKIDLSKTKIQINVSNFSLNLSIGEASSKSALENFLKINKSDEIGLMYFDSHESPFSSGISRTEFPKIKYPLHFFRGIILDNIDEEYPDHNYYIKKGLFIKFCEHTGNILYELDISEGSYNEGILSGKFIEYEDGRYLQSMSIQNGLIK